MTIKEAISRFISHFSPLSLVKQVFPHHQSSQAFSLAKKENKPWMNVNEVELAQDDFV